jgi:phenylacetaldehyde dehydrogenase
MRGNDVTVSVPVVETRSWIDGRWAVPDHEIGSLHDPNTGARRGPQRENSTESVADAIAAADRLFTAQILDDLGPASRAAALGEWAALLDDAAEDIALQDSLSTGNPLSTTCMLAGSLGARVRSLAAEVLNLGDGKELPASGRTVRLLNRSLGPTLILAPWNAPTFVAVSKLAAAFGAGSPSILKPSEWTPAGAQIAFELFVQVLDARALPAASVQLVHGGASVGSALTSDPRVRVITFTGGLAAGRAVARAAAESLANVQLELGSNNPAVVLEGADVERTASDLIAGMTRRTDSGAKRPGRSSSRGPCTTRSRTRSWPKRGAFGSCTHSNPTVTSGLSPTKHIATASRPPSLDTKLEGRRSAASERSRRRMVGSSPRL